jgi:hypothetical protein
VADQLEEILRGLEQPVHPRADFGDQLLGRLLDSLGEASAQSLARRRSPVLRELALAAALVLFVGALAAGVYALRVAQHSAPARTAPTVAPTAVTAVPSSRPGCLPIWTPGEGQPGIPVDRAPVPETMVSRLVGWGAGALRTTDGWAHWRNSAPPTTPGRSSGATEFFLDATHGWVAEAASSSTACVDHVVVFSTVDGGSSWRQAAPIPVTTTSALDELWLPDFLPMGHSMDFIDSQHGWLLIATGRANLLGGINANRGALYRTADGGLHWTLVSTNPGLAALGVGSGSTACTVNGGVTFMSIETGWMQFLCPGMPGSEAALLVTHDGGTSWQVQRLAGSGACFCEAGLPIFFDSTHGIDVVDGGALSLFVTSDRGATWVPRTVPAGAMFVDFVTTTVGWAAVPVSPNSPVAFALYKTTDAGKTWALIDGNLPAPINNTIPLHFADIKTGFWATGYDLRKTADGGRSWSVIPGSGARMRPSP